MVLKGSLREFILADIFNLISQQKITGKLTLTSADKEAAIIFRNGAIVGATRKDEQLTRKLFNLLILSRPIEEAKKIFGLFPNDINGLFNEIIRGGLLHKEVLFSFSGSVVEDIACSVFLWTKGSYHFSSLPYVDNACIPGVTVTVENVIMEAMRRVDEWQRMRQLITEESLFVPMQRQDKEFIPDPLAQPEDYLCTRLDGISSVATIIESTCLTEYKVYESLYALLGSHSITPLSAKIAHTVSAALDKKELQTSNRSKTRSAVLPLIAVAGMVCITIFSGHKLLHERLLREQAVDARLYSLELPLSRSLEKATVASLHHRVLSGTQTVSLDSLLRANLLLPSDILPLTAMRNMKKLPSRGRNHILYFNKSPAAENR